MHSKAAANNSAAIGPEPAQNSSSSSTASERPTPETSTLETPSLEASKTNDASGEAAQEAAS